MAVSRPDFSAKKNKPSRKKKVAPTRPQKRKKKVGAKQKKQEKKKVTSSSPMRLLILFGFILWALYGQDEGQTRELNAFQANPSNQSARFVAQENFKAQTTVFGDVGLTDEQMRRVALSILTVANGMTDEYEVADGLVLTCYILRYFAEIGEYEIAYKDIMILVEAFEEMTKSSVGEEVRDILNQTLKIRFGKKEGRYYAKFFAKNPMKGIIIPINEVSEDPESSLREIRHILVVDGAELNFEEVDTMAEKDRVRAFVKTKIKLLGVIDGILDALNQVYDPLKYTIDSYLEDPTQKVPALIIGMKGVSVDVDTSTVFEDIIFDFNEAYAFPNIKKGDEPIPSFVLGGKSKLLKLKVSVDQ